MKISMKSDYSLRAVLELARHYGQGTIQTSDIAARQDIPEPYLEQLLIALRKANVIRSVRGPQGGHSLARPPQEITVGEIIMALEGSLAPLECVQEQECCSRSVNCVQRDIWMQVNEATRKVLDSTTISDLLERQVARDSRPMYYI